jgi:hypothetical protein
MALSAARQPRAFRQRRRTCRQEAAGSASGAAGLLSGRRLVPGGWFAPGRRFRLGWRLGPGWRFPCGQLRCRSRRRRALVGFDPPEEGCGPAHLEEIHGEHRGREGHEQRHREEVQGREAASHACAPLHRAGDTRLISLPEPRQRDIAWGRGLRRGRAARRCRCRAAPRLRAGGSWLRASRRNRRSGVPALSVSSACPISIVPTCMRSPACCSTCLPLRGCEQRAKLISVGIQFLLPAARPSSLSSFRPSRPSCRPSRREPERHRPEAFRPLPALRLAPPASRRLPERDDDWHVPPVSARSAPMQ